MRRWLYSPGGPASAVATDDSWSNSPRIEATPRNANGPRPRRDCGCERCCRSRRGTESPSSRAASSRSTSSCSRPTGPASTSPRTASRSRPVAELTGVAPMLAGQVKTFHHAIYAGILARRDQPEQLEELRRKASSRSTSSSSTCSPSAPRSGGALVGVDKAIEMIDVGGAALLGAAARNPAGVVAVSSPDQYTQILAELRERGQVSPELRAQLAAEAFGDRRRVPRRDRRLPQPAHRHELPEAPRDGPREGQRPALRREPAPDRRAVPGDDPSLDRRRRRRPACRAARRRSTTCSTSTSRTRSRATTRRRRW